MATEIKRILDDVFTVNGVEVRLDHNNKFVAQGVLVTSEIRDFQEHLKKINYEKKKPFKEMPFDLEDSKRKLRQVDVTLSNIDTQINIINNSANPLSDEAIVLKNFYQNKIKHYEKMRNEITATIPVTVENCSVNRP